MTFKEKRFNQGHSDMCVAMKFFPCKNLSEIMNQIYESLKLNFCPI